MFLMSSNKTLRMGEEGNKGAAQVTNGLMPTVKVCVNKYLHLLGLFSVCVNKGNRFCFVTNAFFSKP